MGGSSYSDDLYHSRAAHRAAAGTPVFDHSHKVATGDTWAGLLGSQNVLALDNPDDVAATIASTIGICEGATDIDGITSDLADVGSAHAAGAITTALAPLARNAPGAIGKADLPPTTAAATHERL